MGNLRKIAVAILLLSFFIFVALFGRLPALRNSPIGHLHRIIWIHIPAYFRTLDRRLTDGRISYGATNLAHYLMYENHPIILIFFVGLLTFSATVFIYYAWHRLSFLHHLLIPLLIPLPYLFTYLCVTSTASYITPSNHHIHMRSYPYDHVLYHPGARCRTCQFQKPARSKHCSVCKTCVAKQDHHCIWVNNCLGRENYRWFLGLLLSLGIILSYGALLASILLIPRLPPRRAGFTGLIDSWAIALIQDVEVGAIGLLALLTAPLAWGLFGYHVYLVWAGMTTNETNKWEDWKLDMADGIVFKGEFLPGHPANALEPPTYWPLRSNQVLVTTDDGKPPRFALNSEHRGFNGHEISWQRCWRLSEVTNLYDIGFWGNLVDIFSLT